MTVIEKCDICGAVLEFPADADPMFEGDTAVTSKCRHVIMVRVKNLEPPARIEDRREGERDEASRVSVWQMWKQYHTRGVSKLRRRWCHKPRLRRGLLLLPRPGG
jgi:hypothetical protein